jgi:prophage antirepressor-like protein
MSNLAVFQFDSQSIRFIDGKPIANDVATVLGYKDPANAISRKIKDKNKGVCKMQTPGGIQSVTVLEEPGIYQLIFGSKLPCAEKFQDWVFEEVLPTIRKTGQYAIAHQIPKTYSQALLEAAKLAEENERLEAQNILLEQQNEQLSEAVDELFNYSSIVRIAKFNGISETRFKWHRLKTVSNQMGLEIKKVPCPRFVEKNLYSHDAWRVAYPGIALPETTTLVIQSVK